MKFLKIVLFLILGFNTSAQIELFQLQWATDSSYVIGSLPSGEPVWVHIDSLGLADSIYLQGDSIIVLKKGSGQVYRSRIWDENDYSSRYDIPNPQLNDLYGDGQKLYYWDGDSWELLDRDGEIGNEGLLGLQQIATNIIGLTSSSNGFDIKHIVGINGIQISTNELDTINIGIDTTLFEAGETQYLNPYVVTGDTTGFYLTVAQDTVLFVNTIDTAAYCCPPSLSGDTLFIAENYVQLPKENLIGGWGITATESPYYTWNIIADSSQVATQYDLTLIGGSQTLSIDSTNRVFEISISGGNTVKFKDTGGVDSTTVVNGYGTTITESPANQFNITVDSSKFATAYDLTQVSGSNSKVIDILGSDFTTSATSLQTTDLAYTFPSTGTYEVKLYGTYTSSNTANGISFGYVESGGLTASFVTGSHYVYDRGTAASASTVGVRGVFGLSTSIATASVANASSPLTIMSEILVTVSATGTLTFNFASESGSYSTTLLAGSSLIVEKLN